MLQIKKNDLPIGLTISVLLSLFVNFSMLMRNYGFRFPAPKGVPVSDVVKVDEFFLYFPLIWFFLFAFLLFVTDSGLYRIGDRLFGKREYKTILFANGITLFTGTMLFVFHPLILNVCMNLALHTPFPELRELFRIHPNPQEMMMHDPRINFGVFPSGRVPPIFLHPQITEHIFVLVTILLCALLIHLLHGKQQMQLEYEQLKTEKWQTSYNALMGQVNPHFFFNSLSGLNALIRNGEKEQTLTYLDELSNVFRYILQSNQKEMVTLAEELQFVKAYAYLLGEKITQNDTHVYLVNTGWTGGPYGIGHRIALYHTRALVKAAQDGSLDIAGYVHNDVFDVEVPRDCPGVPRELLDPRGTWEDPEAYDKAAAELAAKFKENFEKRYPDVDLKSMTRAR